MLHILFYYRLRWKIIQSYWFHHFTRIPIPLPSQCRMYLGNPCSPRLKNQLCFSGFGPWNLSKLWLWLCQIIWWCRPKIKNSWKVLSFIPRTYCFHWKFTGCCLQNRSFTGKFQMNELKLSIFVTCLGGFHISIICSNWYFNCLNALYLNFSRTFFFTVAQNNFRKQNTIMEW